MIVKMSHITVLCTEKSSTEALTLLRSLGLLHITRDQAIPLQSANLTEADKSLAVAEKALNIALSQPKSKAASIVVAPEDVVNKAELVGKLEDEIRSLKDEAALYEPFGSFDLSSVRKLQDDNLSVTLFAAPASFDLASLSGAFVKQIGENKSEKKVYAVAIGSFTSAPELEIIPLPTRSLSEIKSEIAEKEGILARERRELSSFASAVKALSDTLKERKALYTFAAAEAAMGSNGGIAWLTGFCPSEDEDKLIEAAKTNGWAISSREPYEDELPPTLLRPPRIFRPITVLFNMLGISPGYYEADVSVVFYSFFTLFFAMLVGDAGYGSVIMLLTIVAYLKFKNAPKAPFILLGIFSIATIAWGIMTATYFGIAQTAIPAVIKPDTAAWLGNTSNIMQVCFLLGAVHLTIARLWNAASLFPSTKALAEIGWTGVIWTMYFAACLVGVEGATFPRAMWYVTGASIALIYLFMLKRSELKTDGINLAILPLNIMSCLGDIISYVRLFAVGLASVKVAENFNAMAFDLNMPLAAKIPIVVLILLIGHGLNFAMGALSILVHAVRLNTLEFSNHKGISWSGFAYEPFRK